MNQGIKVAARKSKVKRAAIGNRPKWPSEGIASAPSSRLKMIWTTPCSVRSSPSHRNGNVAARFVPSRDFRPGTTIRSRSCPTGTCRRSRFSARLTTSSWRTEATRTIRT
uniref:(northern house mosquito) hypothetical protein n=1 Tax=Culex pipiens TaxID=7175 RepID=A0A8D8CLP8_CULPI